AQPAQPTPLASTSLLRSLAAPASTGTVSFRRLSTPPASRSAVLPPSLLQNSINLKNDGCGLVRLDGIHKIHKTLTHDRPSCDTDAKRRTKLGSCDPRPGLFPVVIWA